MSKGNGLTRGDKNRNRKLARRREMVPPEHAIVAIDLGEDTHMVVVTDHDSKVLARKVVTGKKAYQLGEGLTWAGGKAAEHGYAGVTVGCEPTGSRWLQVQQLCERLGMVFVCVQPFATRLARASEDYTGDKTDYRDAAMIAKLISELKCYIPEDIDERWAVLRHQGRRRGGLVTQSVAATLQTRDMLALAWPVVLDAAADPFDSVNWAAAVAVVLGRCDGNPAKVKKMGRARFETAVRRELPRWGGQRICRRIVHAVFEATTCADGAVAAHRRGALQRAGWTLEDLRTARAKITQTEQAMTAQLDELGLVDLVTSIPGLSAAAAAQILAETGDPGRFSHGRAMVKTAGLNPVEDTSGQHNGKTSVSKRGRPALRLAAWRAAWSLTKHNPVATARFTALTSRDNGRLTRNQAMIAVAAACLRWLYAIITTGKRWDPTIAAGPQQQVALAA